MSNTTGNTAAAGQTTSVPGTQNTSAPAPSATRITAAHSTMFGMPSGIHLPQFDGSGWSNWSGILEAILTLHEAEDVLLCEACPADADQDEWNSIQRRTKAYLRLYVKQDVYSLIALDLNYPSFKHKWDKLKNTYGGALGSTAAFNMWIQLTQARLDDTKPMALQLAKINEAWVALTNASMGITDVQYSLIVKVLRP